MSKLNRVLWSGLVLVGAAACGDDVTVAPPPEPPTGVRSVTVTPDGATIALGATLTFTAAVTTEPGSPAATVAWSSSNTAIATIDATSGVATGVAAGSVGITATATSGTSSAQGSATLTVSSTPSVTPATVSIQSIDQNGAPANINDLEGQVDVRVNLDRGGENVLRVQLLVDSIVVSEQVFASASVQAAAPELVIEEIVFNWNSAAFDSVSGTPDHLNGAHKLAAKVITAENESGTGSPTVSVVLDNDNTAVINVEISNADSTDNSATDNQGLIWYTGDARATAVPVIYDVAAPTISVVRFFGTDLDPKVDSTAPYSVTWAKGTDLSEGGSGGNGLPGVETDEFEVCITAVVNGNLVDPDICSEEIRYDNDAPTTPIVSENPNGRQAGWLNDSASFATVNTPLTPNGMVLAPGSLDVGGVGGVIYRARLGATLDSAIVSTDRENTAGVAPTETGSSLCLALYAIDALGNRSPDPLVCETGVADNDTRIGVDRAPPVLAYTAASLASGARQPGPSVGGEFIVTVADTGTIGNSGVLQPIPVRSSVVRRSADGTSFTDVPVDCVAGGGGIVLGTTPACVRDTVGLVYTPPTLATSIAAVAGAGTHGYYTHSAEARDGAGNSTELPSGRVIVFDATPATATAPAVPAVIGGNFVAASFINDDLSIRDYFFQVSYAAGFFAPTLINLGTPTVVDAFNAPTLHTINFGVNSTVNAFVAFQGAPGGVPAAYAGVASLNGLTVMVRDQAQVAYTASPTTPLAPTAPAVGIPVAGGAGSTAFVFADYVLATSEPVLCAGTLAGGCAAGTKTSTVFSASAAGTTGSFNNPFTRVDFYAASADGSTLVLIGSVPAASATLTDAGGLSRTWKYSLPMAAGALYTALGGLSPAVVATNVYAFGVSATGSVALVSDPVAQTLNP